MKSLLLILVLCVVVPTATSLPEIYLHYNGQQVEKSWHVRAVHAASTRR